MSRHELDNTAVHTERAAPGRGDTGASGPRGRPRDGDHRRPHVAGSRTRPCPDPGGPTDPHQGDAGRLRRHRSDDRRRRGRPARPAGDGRGTHLAQGRPRESHQRGPDARAAVDGAAGPRPRLSPVDRPAPTHPGVHHPRRLSGRPVVHHPRGRRPRAAVRHPGRRRAARPRRGGGGGGRRTAPRCRRPRRPRVGRRRTSSPPCPWGLHVRRPGDGRRCRVAR